MAAAFDARLQLYQQAQQLPPNRVLACDRHPDQQVTGFCASCLRERLAGLDPATRRMKPSPSSSGAPAAAAAALKSLFSRLPGGQLNHHNAATAAAVTTGPSGTALLPELRRCKSFSGGRGAPPAVAFEPQRRSCDVRTRSTLWSLFHLHEGGAVGAGGNPSQVFPPPIYYAASANAGEGEVEIELRSLGLAGPVLETREEEEEHYTDAEAGEPEKEHVGEGDGGIIMEEDEHRELRPMKDHIDLDSQSKKPPPKDIAGGFWLAASVFSEKFRKWRRKHKEKKTGAGPNADARDPPAGTAAAAGAIRATRLSSRSGRLYRDAQSEVAEDAFGRRSCDTDPRFSLDAGGVSFDDPRYSWDEPRASWDGYLLGGGRQAFPRLPPMLSVIEDAPIVAAPSVQRSDGQIPVEEDAAVPGGTAQTREYYSDCLSQRRRRSLDRSSSVRRPSFEAADEPPLPTKGSSNSRVSPTAMANEYFFHHVNRFDRDNRNSKSNSLRDDCSESFESTYRDPLKDGGGSKKSRRWSNAWSLWGLIHRRGDGNGAIAANVVERSLSESWPELRKAHSAKFLRSNSSVSSRNSFGYRNGNIGLSSMRRNGVEMNVHSGMKRREEFVLERNRSARYSPGHADNGLLRFYLTPMSSSRRSKGLVKGWHKNTHPFTRNMLRLY